MLIARCITPCFARLVEEKGSSYGFVRNKVAPNQIKKLVVEMKAP